mgnify:CR=1 FL=1
MSERFDLTARVNSLYTQLPPKQQAVARVLAEDLPSLLFASAADIARRAGVDTATVVRTCQSLGFTGWRELHQQVRRALENRPTFAERVAALAGMDGDLTGRIFEVACENVTETGRGIDREALAAAAAAIARAQLIVVAAAGVSEAPGQFLTSSLQIVGHRALLTTGSGDAAPALAPLAPGDVVIAISLWRYLRVTVQTLQHAAQAAGTTTIAITDSPVSPVARLADHVFVARTASAGPRMGLTGVISLLEALVAQVAVIDPERSRRATGVANALYFDENVLAEPATGVSRHEAWHRRLDQR